MLSDRMNGLMARLAAAKRGERGVTLIELMTVVVILAILASIAVPSYRRYLMRSQRTDATRALLQVQANEEKYFLQYNQYTSDLTGALNATPPGLGMSQDSPGGFYTISIALGRDPLLPTAQSFTVTATPISGRGQQSDSQCTALTLDDVGKQDATGSATDPKTCWK